MPKLDGQMNKITSHNGQNRDMIGSTPAVIYLSSELVQSAVFVGMMGFVVLAGKQGPKQSGRSR
jgi:hypothetical protein